MHTRTLKSIVAAGAITLAAIAAITTTSAPASAGAENLLCGKHFKKVATYHNAIKCKQARGGLSSQGAAHRVAKPWRGEVYCNAHQSPPKLKIWKKSDGWAARMTYICAIIY